MGQLTGEITVGTDGSRKVSKTSEKTELSHESAVINRIADDLQTKDKGTRPFIRYFIFLPINNSTSVSPSPKASSPFVVPRQILDANEAARRANGLSRMLNSLSYRRSIVRPYRVGTDSTVFRIDLRDYGWDPQVWDRLLESYPYAMVSNSKTARSVYADTDCRLPYVRGDWFCAVASRPPLYHELLRLPSQERELEKQLKVDTLANIALGRAARAGISQSQVSRSNRLLERHEMQYGAYWKSYDFATNTGKGNLFIHPLGPGKGPGHFQHDGGEIIFNLPNGLQAYMLVDRKGDRIDEAPINIVRDYSRAESVIVNGISCIGCHYEGMQGVTGGQVTLKDEVLGHVVTATLAKSFIVDELSPVRALYRPHAVFDEFLKSDQKRFLAAATEANLVENPSTFESREPISALVDRFDGDMRLANVAAEFCMDPKELEAQVKQSPLLANIFGMLMSERGVIKRRSFEEHYPNMIRFWKSGEMLDRIAPKTTVPIVQTETEEEAESAQDETLTAAESSSQNGYIRLVLVFAVLILSSPIIKWMCRRPP